MLEIKTLPVGGLKIDRSEIYRYLGYKNPTDADLKVKELIEELTEEIEAKAECRVCFDKYPVCFNQGREIDLGFLRLKSASLEKNLKGCISVCVFVATIGIAVDRLIQKYVRTFPSKAVIIQSVGAAGIEKWCDIFCDTLKSRELQSGHYLRPRFSPGYGDFPLESQNKIFSFLDCGRKIGVTLTDGFQMLPSKSVSGIIGISKQTTDCTLSGCEYCNNFKCEFRRN